MVAPVARHPTNSNGIIVFDLRQDPEALLECSAEEIAERLFTPRDEMPDGKERIALKTVHLNKCPVVVPMTTLTEQAATRWDLDPAVAERHRQQLQGAVGLEQKIQSVHASRRFEPINDPDRNLYGGGFFSDGDRRRMEQIRQMSPRELARSELCFDDGRLPEMLFRYRARNWPNSLSQEERERWEEFRRDRLNHPEAGGSITLKAFRQELAKSMIDPGLTDRDKLILSQLADWPEQLGL